MRNTGKYEADGGNVLSQWVTLSNDDSERVSEVNAGNLMKQ